LILLLISVLAFGSAVFLYIKNPRRAGLRVLALLIILLLAVSFTIRYRVRKKTGPPILLIDASQSMARHLAEIKKRVAALGFPHERFFIRDTFLVGDIGPADTLGAYTDLTLGLLKAAAANPSAIILVSDGYHNFGPDPSTLMDDWHIPIYAVAAGAESLRDQAILDIAYPEYVFRNDSVTIAVTVESRGFDRPEPSRLTLESVDKKIAFAKTFILSGAPAKTKLEFSFLVRETKPITFRLSLPPQNGETDYANNVRDFRLTAFDQKIKVFYYTDHPSFNTRFLIPVLKTMPNIDLRAAIRLAPERIADYFTMAAVPEPMNGLTADVWILDNVDCRLLPDQDLKGFLNRGKGILFIGGIANLPDNLRAILPIPIAGRLPIGEYPIRAVERFSVLIPGDDYPPFSAVNRAIGVNPNTVTIALSDKLPVVAYRNYGLGTVFQINASEIGVWQFSQSGTKNENLLAGLIPDIVRFLSPFGVRNRLVLKTRQSAYEVGAKAEVTLQSYDRDLRPAGGGDFYLALATVRIPFFETKPGNYETEFLPQKSGDYELTAIGVLNGDTLKSNVLTITVAPRTAETEQGINHEVLRVMAEKTGGRYVPFGDLDKLSVPTAADYRETRSFSLDHPVIYLVAFLLLAADWLLRRRRGTL
jgi:hypothetical protein